MSKFNTYPVDIELNPYDKRYSNRYYPSPHINKETNQKELTRLVDIFVLTLVQQYESGTTVIIIVKRKVTVIFLTNFCLFNKIIFQKTFPIPRNGTTMQQLEGIQFATALDLNMGYYTIQLDV